MTSSTKYVKSWGWYIMGAIGNGRNLLTLTLDPAPRFFVPKVELCGRLVTVALSGRIHSENVVFQTQHNTVRVNR